MIHAGTLIWTKRGWRKAEELIIGDTVISYNPSRNCTEYDNIKSIQMDYGTNPIFGLRTHSMNMTVTPDHPFIIVNKVNKTIERKTISDVFLSFLNKNRTVLYTSPFEPFLLSKNMDNVAWSARLAASFGYVRYMPIEYVRQIWDIIDDLCGVEAQTWLDEFYHWNILRGGTYWSKAVRLKNLQARDMVYHIAPRAGFGARYMLNPQKPTGPKIMGLSTNRFPVIISSNWFKDRITSHTFNIGTTNGSFLARYGGTFLCACDEA